MVTANPRHEIDRPADLLGCVDVVSGRGLDAADVHDLGSVADDLSHSIQRRIECERGPAVIERIRGSIDDRHDQQRILVKAVSSEGQHRCAR